MSGKFEIKVREFGQILTEYYEHPEELPEELTKYDYSKNRIMIRDTDDISYIEYEFKVDRHETDKLKKLINKHLINEFTIVYVKDGNIVKLSDVDNIWHYIEIEFNSEDEAINYEFPFADILVKEIKDWDAYIKNYWHNTRGD